MKESTLEKVSKFATFCVHTSEYAERARALSSLARPMVTLTHPHPSPSRTKVFNSSLIIVDVVVAINGHMHIHYSSRKVEKKRAVFTYFLLVRTYDNTKARSAA